MPQTMSCLRALLLVLVCLPAAAQAPGPQPVQTQPAPATPPTSPVSCSDTAAHPEFRQLDFWVGTWDVFSGDKKIAEVEVRKVLHDCALSETWKGLHGSDGMGLSTFNQRTHHWEYFWVSDRGATSHFEGALLPGEMRYRMQQPQPAGGSRLRHWSLIQLPGGKVRELSVASSDDGVTWSTEYDYVWAPKI